MPLKFPEWNVICADPSVIDAYEAYRKRVEMWRVDTVKELKEKLELLKKLPKHHLIWKDTFEEVLEQILEMLK